MKKLFVFIAVALLLALTATGALATEAVKINGHSVMGERRCRGHEEQRVPHRVKEREGDL